MFLLNLSAAAWAVPAYPTCAEACEFYFAGTWHTDTDCDGWIDDDDNCDTVANDQMDLDSDGVGDACDACPDDNEDAPGPGADGCPDTCVDGTYDSVYDGIPVALGPNPTTQESDFWSWGSIDGSNLFTPFEYTGRLTGTAPSRDILNWRAAAPGTSAPQVAWNPTLGAITYNNTSYAIAPYVTLAPTANAQGAAVAFTADVDGVYDLEYAFTPARTSNYPTNSEAVVAVDSPTRGTITVVDSGPIQGFDHTPVSDLTGASDVFLYAGDSVIFGALGVQAPNSRYTVRLDAAIYGTCD